jgi:hypothetical protein
MPKIVMLNDAQIKELKEFSQKKDIYAKEGFRAQAILMLDKGIDVEFIEEFTGLKGARSSDFERNF